MSKSIKWIGRWDRSNRLLRLVRIVPNDGRYKLSIGLRASLYYRVIEGDGWIVNVLGVRLHMRRVYGGRFAQ